MPMSKKISVVVGSEFDLEVIIGKGMTYKEQIHALMTLNEYVTTKLRELTPLIMDTPQPLKDLAEKVDVQLGERPTGDEESELSEECNKDEPELIG